VSGEVPEQAGGLLAGFAAGSRVAGYLLEEQVPGRRPARHAARIWADESQLRQETRLEVATPTASPRRISNSGSHTPPHLRNGWSLRTSPRRATCHTE
jgi:hypothetical protein